MVLLKRLWLLRSLRAGNLATAVVLFSIVIGGFIICIITVIVVGSIVAITGLVVTVA